MRIQWEHLFASCENRLKKAHSTSPKLIGLVIEADLRLFKGRVVNKTVTAIIITSMLTISPLLFGGEITTIMGTGRDDFTGDGGPALNAGSGQPFGLETGPDGALYVCEFSNHVIRRIDPKTTIVTTVAGTGRKAGYAGDGGPATSALMNQPHELRFDTNGNYYISDMLGQAIRRVDARTKVITTVAGNGTAGFSGDDGPAIKAQLNLPISVVLDRKNDLLICDINNHRIRRVDQESGQITTMAGTGLKQLTPDGAPIQGSPLNGPRTLAVEPTGDLIIVLREGCAVFRAEMKSRTLKQIAGTGKQGYSGDGKDARLAQLSGPKGVAVDPHGNILLCDTENHCVRIIRKDGTIETLIGDGQAGDGPDGDPKACRLTRPHGVFVGAGGVIYVGDSGNNKVRCLSP